MFKYASVTLINIYQRILRFAYPSHCRFWPTCSEYTKQGILKYGLLIGLTKGGRRILSCHPWSKRYGYDPLG
ncbi:MAG: membrane protein insertion efficiency factor YidD [Candidatus Omnitrophota bacterium]